LGRCSFTADAWVPAAMHRINLVLLMKSHCCKTPASTRAFACRSVRASGATALSPSACVHQILAGDLSVARMRCRHHRSRHVRHPSRIPAHDPLKRRAAFQVRRHVWLAQAADASTSKVRRFRHRGRTNRDRARRANQA
jgi:hypothetical protein